MTSATRPTIGRIVHYRQARGSTAWLPAIVTVTAETYVAGMWHDVPVTLPSPILTMSGNPVATVNQYPGDQYASERPIDRDGQVYEPAHLPPVKEGRVHLRVISPTAADYVEFNVAEGDEPGTWRWPPMA